MNEQETFTVTLYLGNQWMRRIGGRYKNLSNAQRGAGRQLCEVYNADADWSAKIIGSHGTLGFYRQIKNLGVVGFEWDERTSAQVSR